MKKLTLTVIAALISCITFAQIEIRGRVTQINKCELLDEGGYKILKSTYPYRTNVKLNDNELLIINDHYLQFKLSDKMVDSSDNQLTINYMSTFHKKPIMVAVMECENGIKIGIFSMDGNNKFTEYIIPKPRVAKQQSYIHLNKCYESISYTSGR